MRKEGGRSVWLRTEGKRLKEKGDLGGEGGKNAVCGRQRQTEGKERLLLSVRSRKWRREGRIETSWR